MVKINKDFCGYLKIDSDKFAYFVSDHMVTLLPAEGNQQKQYEIFGNMCSRNVENPEYFLGSCDNGFPVALLRTGKISRSFSGMDLSGKFWAPMIIKGTGNACGYYNQMTSQWNTFHAVTFYGANINSLYNPEIAIQPRDFKERNFEVKLRPYKDFSHSINFDFKGQRATLDISVIISAGEENDIGIGAYNIGKLNSYMRIHFEEAQDFHRIEDCYNIVKNLIAILTTQNNITFESYLSQRNHEGTFFDTAVCKTFNQYENYSTRKQDKVIEFYKVIDLIPNLIEKINNNELNAVLAILPENNKELRRISITNVQDLCTALEIAYGWTSIKKRKEPIIEELKTKIKSTIKDFADEHNEIDVYKETTISSAFQYLDYTLKQKILALYNENHFIIDRITSKWNIPKIDEESIGRFVKLRNGKTHAGIIDWGENAQIYTALFALVYISLFKHVGMTQDRANNIIQYMF